MPNPCTSLLARIGGDESALMDLLDVFLDDAPGRVDAIRSALTAGDATALHRAAHSYKGAAAMLEADDVVQSAGQLESLAHGGILSGASEIVERLERHSRALVQTLRTYRASVHCAHEA